MYHAHSPLFPETPRLHSVSLPDDLNEDTGFLTQAFRPTIAPLEGEGNTLGLLGMIAANTVPFMKDLGRRLHALSINSPGKSSKNIFGNGSLPPSPTAPAYAYEARGGRSK